MKQFTYLLIIFLTIIICFGASFHHRIRFNKHFATFLLAATIVAAPFIVWDVWFTKTGVWWFNESYTIGLAIAGLPLEEWLFFYCIPFACVFTFFCLEKFFDLSWASAFNNLIVFTGSIVCVLVILTSNSKVYTLVTAVATLSTLFFLHFIARREWIGAATLVYLILLPGFFVVNGPLTGLWLNDPVVNYNNNEILGARFFTIPIEDAAYGFTLFLLNIYFFKLFQKTGLNKPALV